MHTIDHLGIAVKSLAQARKFYEQLGLDVLNEETVPHEKVKVAMIPSGPEPHRAAGSYEP